MYSRLLASYPVTTKCITSGFMFSLGDVLTQKLIDKNQKIDWKRNMYLAATGTFYLGPILHVWYSKFLPQLVNRVMGSTGGPVTTTLAGRAKAAIPGTLFDQLLFAPAFLSGFFVFSNFIKQFSVASAEKGVEQCKQKIGEAMISNWKIWPAATFINLLFIPIQYRVLYANFIGLFWNMYLSYLSHR